MLNVRSWLLASVVLVSVGCAPVKAWQRGVLASPSMDPNAGDRACYGDFFVHTFDVREGATGGAGHAGGGCGCN